MGCIRAVVDLESSSERRRSGDGGVTSSGPVAATTIVEESPTDDLAVQALDMLSASPLEELLSFLTPLLSNVLSDTTARRDLASQVQELERDVVALAVKSNEYQEQTMSSSARTSLWDAICTLQERVNAAVVAGMTVIDVLDAAAEAEAGTGSNTTSREASQLLAALQKAGLSMSFTPLDESLAGAREKAMKTKERDGYYDSDGHYYKHHEVEEEEEEEEEEDEESYEVVLRLQSGPEGTVHTLRAKE